MNSIRKAPTRNCPLLVGTSGYSYTEWTDAGFYPAGTPSGKMLSFYTRAFPVTELNYTWYQMPRDEAVERMRHNVPELFRYAAKLTRTMTHEIDLRNWREEVARYRDGRSRSREKRGCHPLQSAPVLGSASSPSIAGRNRGRSALRVCCRISWAPPPERSGRAV